MPVAIFDMDGVLYRGAEVLPHAPETLGRLREAGWQVFFATNNSTATRDEYATRLRRLGLGGDAEHVVTSAYATACHLARLVPSPADVFVLGAEGLRIEIRDAGVGVRDALQLPGLEPPDPGSAAGGDPAAMLSYLEDLPLPLTPDAVVVGLDLGLTYAKLAEAQRGVLAGALFIASNKYRAYPVRGRVLPGAGSIVRALEVATGRAALCMGKPEAFLFQEALRRAGPDPGACVVIGDAPEYDIVAAHAVGATGVLITTGLTDADGARRATGEAAPDHVIGALDELFSLPAFAGA
ncbi:HAD-IIA family hydrolase [soil metagenome]